MEKFVDVKKKGFYQKLKEESDKGRDIIIKKVKFDREYNLVYTTFVYRLSGKVFGIVIENINRKSKKDKWLVTDDYGVPYNRISVCDLICDTNSNLTRKEVRNY